MNNRLTLLRSATCTVLILTGSFHASSASSLLPAEQVQPMPNAIAGKPQLPKPKLTPDPVELAALYYYAQQGQKERVDREIRRISIKYPDFAVPGDLFQPVEERKVDETVLWRLYEKDDYVGIDNEISRLASENTGWEPSSDFQQKLNRRKQRFEMVRATKAEDWAAVIAAGHDLDPKASRKPTCSGCWWMPIAKTACWIRQASFIRASFFAKENSV